MTIHCKELEERTTQLNEHLGFNTFCETTANANKEKWLKLSYVTLQMNYFINTQRFLPDNLAEEISLKNFEFAKQEGKLDILNRTIN